jgi:acyl-coenzyme A thioesterase PaaI-like protein
MSGAAPSTSGGLLGRPPTADESFINDIEYAYEIADDRRGATGWLRLNDAVRSPSGARPRLSVIATVTDVMIGVAACFHTLPKVAVTVDLSVASLAPTDASMLDIEVTLLKVGRSITAAELRCREAEGGRDVVAGFMNFATTRNPLAYAPEPSTSSATTGRLEQPFTEHVGLRTTPGGDCEIALGPDRSNAVGGLQGGLVTLLGEAAAERLAGRDIIELDVRFLHSLGVGPGRSRAVALSEDVFRSEVRDPGREDRVCAVMLARAEPGR